MNNKITINGIKRKVKVKIRFSHIEYCASKVYRNAATISGIIPIILAWANTYEKDLLDYTKIKEIFKEIPSKVGADYFYYCITYIGNRILQLEMYDFVECFNQRSSAMIECGWKVHFIIEKK